MDITSSTGRHYLYENNFVGISTNTATCVVCFERGDKNNPFYDKCMCREIHQSCIREYIQSNLSLSECPICKTPFQYKTIISKKPLLYRILNKIDCYKCVLPFLYGSVSLLSWIITFTILHTIKNTQCTSCKSDESRYCKIINTTLITCLIVHMIYYVCLVIITFATNYPQALILHENKLKIRYKFIIYVYIQLLICSMITSIKYINTFDTDCNDEYNIQKPIKTLINLIGFCGIIVIGLLCMFGIIFGCIKLRRKILNYKAKINMEFRTSEIVGI
jgi:hypothetical protein